MSIWNVTLLLSHTKRHSRIELVVSTLDKLAQIILHRHFCFCKFTEEKTLK